MGAVQSKRADPGVGDRQAPRGSEEWAQAVRIWLQSSVKHLNLLDMSHLSKVVVDEQAWQKMNKPDGSYFASFEEFCRHPDPYGLGMEPGRLWGMIQNGMVVPKVKDWKRIAPHPACELFPLCSDTEIEKLAQDIRENGLTHSIVLLRLPDTKNSQGLTVYNWQLLDGRNRLRACELSGVTPHFVEWQGHGDPTAWVISTNLHRRHLTDSQRAMVAARARETVFAPKAKERQVATLKQGEVQPGPVPLNCGERGKESADQAAEALNVSRAQVERAATVIAKGTPELIASVDRGEVAVSAAAEIAKLPKAEQAATVQAGPKAVKDKAKEIRDGSKGGQNNTSKTSKSSSKAKEIPGRRDVANNTPSVESVFDHEWANEVIDGFFKADKSTREYLLVKLQSAAQAVGFTLRVEKNK